MTLKKQFPAPTGQALSSVDNRADLAGLVVRTTAGVPRAGVLQRSTAALVASRASMAVDVAAFEAVLVRSNLPGFIQNDGVVTVPVAAAPGANKIIDLIWVRQRENSSPFADGDDLPVFGHTASAASASPVPDWASVPAGALVLASVEIPNTATTTQSVGVVITQLAPYTALSGAPIPVKDATILALTGADHGNVVGYAEAVRVLLLDSNSIWRLKGASWVLESGSAAYTPALTGITVGNGVLNSHYSRVGDMVHVEGTFTFGSTSSATAAAFKVSTPVNMDAKYAVASSKHRLGGGAVIDLGTATFAFGVYSDAVNSRVAFWLGQVSGGIVVEGATVGNGLITFVTGDQISWSFDFAVA